MQAKLSTRILFLTLMAVVYVVTAWFFDWLGFAPAKDEIHYWPTTLRFAAEPLPSVELLRSYDEYSTPLPFMIFGWLESAFGAGLFAGRLFNALLSFGIACVFVLTARAETSRVLLSVVGAWSFPYLIGTSVYLYTDVLAVAGAFVGLVSIRRQHWILSAAAFVVAVSSRQYMVAVPIAIAVYRITQLLSGTESFRRRLQSALIDPTLLACAAGFLALLGWIVFFWGLTPPYSSIAPPSTTSAGIFFPQHGLYFLAVIGVYYVPLAWLLLDRGASKEPFRMKRALLASVLLLAVAFFIFPPLGNPDDYGIETMGFLDKFLRWVLGEHEALRLVVLWGAASLCFWRFRRWSLASALVWTHALLLMKAHIAWDKYAMICLLCLWYLQADAPATPSENTDSKKQSDRDSRSRGRQTMGSGVRPHRSKPVFVST